MKNSQNATSARLEVKEMANVLEEVKTTIQQRYPNTVVNLKAERKGAKTGISIDDTGSYTPKVEKLIRAYVKTYDLLANNGFTVYSSTRPTIQSETDGQ